MTEKKSPKLHSPNESQPQVIYLQPAPEAVEDEINLLDYWRVLLRYKWLVLFFPVCAAAIAVLFSLSMKTMYRAEAILASTSDEKGAGLSALANQFGGLAVLAGINPQAGGSKAARHMAVLNSREFTAAFIKENNLMPILFAERWDEQAKKWKEVDGVGAPSDWDAYEVFNGIRRIEQDKKTNMIILSVEWSDPDLAAKWANELVARLNKYQKLAEIEEAQKSIDYLNQQLEQTSVVEMRKAIFNIIEAQTKSIMMANVRDQFAFTVVDPAVVPQVKSGPKRKQMVMIGAAAGLMLGVFAAFFLSFIQRQRELATKKA